MKFFIDLIAKSYLEYTQENDKYIAQFYFQEYYKVRPDAKATEVYSKKQFYTKLVAKLDSLIKKSISKESVPIGTDTLISIFSATEAEIDDATEAHEYDMKDQNAGDYGNKELLDYYFKRPNLPLTEPLWETCDDAATLMYGINKVKIVLKDPISIINPNIDIYPKPLVLRKSKLEYLKKEAVRASEATTIAELDDPQDLSAQNSITSKYAVKNSHSIVELAIEEYVSEALKIIKPLGGVYKGKIQLNLKDLERLGEYVKSIIISNSLPPNIETFPKLSIPSQFIRKTFHNVYTVIDKRNRPLFIDLIHKFEQFENVVRTTTNSKFSSDEPSYGSYLSKIKL